MKFRKHKMIEAIYKAHEVNQEVIEFIDTDRSRVRKAKAFLSRAVQFLQELFDAIKEIVPPAEMEVAVFY